MNTKRYRNDPKYRRYILYRHTLKGKESHRKANQKYRTSLKGKKVQMKAIKKYWNSPKGKEAIKKAIRKYQHSPKGKEVMIECNKRFHKNHPTYSKDYAKSRRAEAKERGICIRCVKRKARIGKVLCSICLANNRESNG